MNVKKTYLYDHAGRKIQFIYGVPAVSATLLVAEYTYDNVSRLIKKKIKPLTNYEVPEVGIDYINRPPALQELYVQDIAQKAIVIDTGFVADASNPDIGTYTAQIDTTLSSGQIDALQTIDYEYNIRGGVNCINCKNHQVSLGNKQNDLFSMRLDYNEDNRYYDGNISKQIWKTPIVPKVQQYLYSYDASSRLLKAKYNGGNSGSNYSLDTVRYDKNGNILQLKRNSIDNLSYTYNGNQLLSVTDAGTSAGFNDGNTSGNDYEYWTNGSLKKDKNKGIDSIVYHSFLNKVSRVKFSNGNWINFYYDGTGVLLKRKLSNGVSWRYIDDLVTKNDTLYQINQDEGRVTYDVPTDIYTYEFEYRDHLGNLRVSFRDSLASPISGVYKPPVVVQVEDRDPTGFSLSDLNYAGVNKNSFGFIQRESFNEIGWINLNNRFYMPELMRFGQIDPLIENQENFSPYQYAWNNPVFRSDPNGTCPVEPCPQVVIKRESTKVTLRPLVNVPYGGFTSPSFSLTLTEGSQIGAQGSIGSIKVGGELNVGSKEIFKMTEFGSSSDPTTNGAENSAQLDPSTTKGFSVSVGAVAVGAGEKTKSETVMTNIAGTSLKGEAVKTTRENQASVEVGIKSTPLVVSLEKTKTTTTYLGTTTVQHGGPSVNVGASAMAGSDKKVKGLGVSITAYYKIEVKFDPIQAFKNYFGIK